MSVSPERLYHDTPPTVSTDLYVATYAVTILSILCVNIDGSARNISIEIDPANGAPQSILANRQVGANDFVRVPGPIPLAPGDKITGRNTSGAAYVAVMIAGLRD